MSLLVQHLLQTQSHPNHNHFPLMPGEDHYRKLERMNATAPINAYYNPTLRISNGKAELSIPVRSEFFHAAEAVHGSVYFKALDDAAFFAVNSLVDDVFVLTTSFTTYLVRPISAGTMHATGRVVHEGKQLFVAESELKDDNGRLIARGNGTFMKSAFRLDPSIGYR